MMPSILYEEYKLFSIIDAFLSGNFKNVLETHFAFSLNSLDKDKEQLEILKNNLIDA